MSITILTDTATTHMKKNVLFCFFLLLFISESFQIYSSFRTRDSRLELKWKICERFVGKYEKKFGENSFKFRYFYDHKIPFFIECRLLKMYFDGLNKLEKKRNT